MALNIKKDVLTYYIERSNLSLDDLKNSIPNIELFITGEKQPTFNQLSEIAKKLNVPTGLLLLNELVSMENVRLEFRTIDSIKEQTAMSNELKDTILEMQEKQDFLHNEIDYELDFIGKFSIKNDFLIVANFIREKLSIPTFFQKEYGQNPLNYLREKISKLGIFVFFNGKVKSNTHRPLDLNEFRGFALIDKKAPIIFINQADSKAGQLFTLIHELVHLFIGVEEIFTIVDAGEYKFDPVEAFVNKVTAEILVPQESFLDLSKQTNDNIEVLANRFKVSNYVIARRLLHFKKITKKEYETYISSFNNNLLNFKSKRKENGGNYKNNIRFMYDKNFIFYVNQAIKDRRMSYTDAFNITGVSYKGYKALTEA